MKHTCRRVATDLPALEDPNVLIASSEVVIVMKKTQTSGNCVPGYHLPSRCERIPARGEIPPEMPDNNPITLITVRIALVCYVIVVGLLLAGCRGPRWRNLLRPLWTIGCLVIVAHVITAFHYSHHWSHDDAIRSTAKQTEQLIGWAFGAGLYFNYLFLLVWIADVMYWWLRPERYESRPVWLEYGIHGYLFFIAVNGAVIFESGVTRICGVLTIVIFAMILVRRRLKSR